MYDFTERGLYLEGEVQFQFLAELWFVTQEILTSASDLSHSLPVQHLGLCRSERGIADPSSGCIWSLVGRKTSVSFKPLPCSGFLSVYLWEIYRWFAFPLPRTGVSCKDAACSPRQCCSHASHLSYLPSDRVQFVCHWCAAAHCAFDSEAEPTLTISRCLFLGQRTGLLPPTQLFRPSLPRCIVPANHPRRSESCDEAFLKTAAAKRPSISVCKDVRFG